MGAVTVDLLKDELQYKDISFSSFEDVYDVLLKLDLIHNDFKDGNLYAGFIYNDLVNLIKKINNSQYIKLYHDIQLGIIPMIVFDHDKTIEEFAAEKLNISSYEYIEKLNENIQDIVNLNCILWLESINKTYKNKLIKNESDDKKILTHINDEKLKELDFIRKYVYSNERYQLDELPKDIQELYDFRDYIIKKIDEFKDMKEKYYEKDDVLFEYYKSRLSQYETIKIGVNKDISILKKHYSIPKGNQNNKGKKEFISYYSDDGSIPNKVLIKHEYQNYHNKLSQHEKLESEVYVSKIKEIAKKILTNRQYIIFELYYLNGFTQQETADIMGIPRPNVTSELKIIINKIKKNM